MDNLHRIALLIKSKTLSISKMDIAELFLYFLVAFYPILPAYFGIFNFAVPSIISTMCIFFIFISKNRAALFKPYFIFTAIIVIMLICSGPVLNGELVTPTFLNYFSSLFILPLFCAIQIDSKKKFRRCLNILTVSAAVLCLLSTTELFGFNIFSKFETLSSSILDSSTGKRYGIYRLESSFGQSIAFGIYLNFIALITFYMCITKEGKAWIKYFVLFLIFNVFCFLTLSRMPIIVMVIIDIFCLIIAKGKLRTTLLFSLIGMVGTLLLLSLFFNVHIFTELFQNISQLFTKSDTTTENEYSFSYRMYLLQNVWKVIGFDNNYLFGVGITNRYSFLYIDKAWPLIRDSVDNSYLLFIVQFGIVGFAGWLIYYIAPTFLSFNKSDYGKTKKIFFIALTCVLLLNFLTVAIMEENRSFKIIYGIMLSQSTAFVSASKNNYSPKKHNNATLFELNI